jgi:hypothetical protein
MFSRLLVLVCLVFLTQFPRAQQPQTATGDIPETCPVTTPLEHSFVPPPPYPRKAPSGTFWFGTDLLWTVLPENSTWRGGSLQYAPSGPPLREKFVWFRQSYDRRTEPQSYLTVTGRRLDAPAPPLTADQSKTACCWAGRDQTYTGTVLNIPTLGCWEITVHHEDNELTLVLWVAK